MPEPSPDRNESLPASAERRAIRWDALAAIIASLVGLLALVVAGYTAYIQRYTAQLQAEQVQAQVWPRLLIVSGNVPGHEGVRVRNQGVGPAIVQSVQVLVAGKPMNNWNALEKTIGFDRATPITVSALNKMVLAPGENFWWIRFQNAADVDSFREDWARARAEVRVCYTSTLGQSWMLVFHPLTVAVPYSVSQCPKLPNNTQFGVM